LKKWERVHGGLKLLSAVAGIAAAGALAADYKVAAAILGATATHAFTLAFQLPRDKWTPEQRQRRSTRSNPLLTPAPVDPKGVEGG
jgi:hypothetical protein